MTSLDVLESFELLGWMGERGNITFHPAGDLMDAHRENDRGVYVERRRGVVADLAKEVHRLRVEVARLDDLLELLCEWRDAAAAYEVDPGAAEAFREKAFQLLQEVRS
jgi:hypothetical protein